MDSLRTAPPATPASAGVYKPISGLAVAALIAGIVTGLLLLAFGIAAMTSHRPFLNWFVLVLAFGALGLAIAAKIQLARSEGTRAGGKVASLALFLNLALALGYMAYWFAIDFSVRGQSRDVADQFLGFLENGEPERAFRLTREPSQQKTIPEDPETIRRRFGNTDLALFHRADLPRLFRTWKGRNKVLFNGVFSWDTAQTGFESELNYTLKTPEGQFPFHIATAGTDDPDTGNRGWQILFHKTGLMKEQRRFTTLGKLTIDLQYKNVQELKDWYLRFVTAGAKAAEPLIRVDGAVPPSQQRAQIAEELMQPHALNVYPGDPARPMGDPEILITDKEVLISNVVSVSAPTLGNEINALLTLRVKGDRLVNEMVRLAGPNWESEPLNTTPESELNKFDVEFETVELNIRVSGPKMTQRRGPTDVMAPPPPGH